MTLKTVRTLNSTHIRIKAHFKVSKLILSFKKGQILADRECSLKGYFTVLDFKSLQVVIKKSLFG